MFIILQYILLFIFVVILLNLFNKDISIGRSYTCNYVKKSNIENDVFIYFSILLNNSKIILIGVSNPYKKYKFSCYLMYNYIFKMCNVSVEKLYDVKGKIKLSYLSLYIKLQTTIAAPKAIKINNNIIPLLFNKPNNKYNIILAIVNFFQIVNYKLVLDVIELSKLYGVDHIVIYVTSSTLFIKSILFYYLKIRFIELVPFCFNSEIKLVHHKGQVEKINDVLYRYMYHAKYIIFNDIDEIIVPINNNNYINFINTIDNHSSDMYLFKSKLFPYFSSSINSITKNTKCCIIEKGYEKFIVGNLYKYAILSVHQYMKSLYPIRINYINENYGYVRHTRYRGKMCKTNLTDTSLNYMENYLMSIYKKFENMFNYSSTMFYYGIKQKQKYSLSRS